MRTYALTILSFLVLAIVPACSDVGFQSTPKLSCDDVSRDQTTECVNKTNVVAVSFTFGVGEVDILFVNDNSGSMFVEQRKMADAFSNFIGSISNLFYQIAIITTDVSASPNNSVKKAANGNGAFQDGKFLEFKDEQGNASGLTVLKRETPNAEALFRSTIERNETKDCDNSGFNPASCPSTDERGIYAANLAIKRGSPFFRSGAHLAVVILSDEDERGQGGVRPSDLQLEYLDLPESLVQTLEENYPTKSLSVHSIVTKDESCRLLQTQASNTGGWPTKGTIGTQYMKLSNPSAELLALGNLMPGVVGSICDSNYVAEMGNIAANVTTNTYEAPKRVACIPESDTIRILTNPVGYESQVQYEIDDQRRARFWNIPTGVKVTFSYECPRY